MSTRDAIMEQRSAPLPSNSFGMLVGVVFALAATAAWWHDSAWHMSG